MKGSSIAVFASASGTFSTLTLINNNSGLAASLTYHTTIDAVFTVSGAPLAPEEGPFLDGIARSLIFRATDDYFALELDNRDGSFIGGH
jgi:hypothetical protein